MVIGASMNATGSPRRSGCLAAAAAAVTSAHGCLSSQPREPRSLLENGCLRQMQMSQDQLVADLGELWLAQASACDHSLILLLLLLGLSNHSLSPSLSSPTITTHLGRG